MLVGETGIDYAPRINEDRSVYHEMQLAAGVTSRSVYHKIEYGADATSSKKIIFQLGMTHHSIVCGAYELARRRPIASIS